EAVAVRAGERVAPGESRREAEGFGLGHDAAFDRSDVGHERAGPEVGGERREQVEIRRWGSREDEQVDRAGDLAGAGRRVVEGALLRGGGALVRPRRPADDSGD